MTTEPTGHLPKVQRWHSLASGLANRMEGMHKRDDGHFVTYAGHVAALRACEARLYTLMGAAIQSGIEAEQKRIRFAIAALVDGDVIDLSLSGRVMAAYDVGCIGAWSMRADALNLTDGTRLVRLNDAVKAAKGDQA